MTSRGVALWIAFAACGRIGFDPLRDRGGPGGDDGGTDGSNNGDGGAPACTTGATFGSARAYPAGSSPVGVAAGDVDGDGVVDLAIINDVFEVGTTSILHGTGGGVFGAPSPVPLGDDPEYIVLADVNHDGALDLITTTDGYVGIQLGDGHGAFGQITTYIAGGAGFPMAIAVGDFDGDGNLDVIAPPLDSPFAYVLLGDGAGGYGSATIAHDGFPYGLAVADLDGDGRSDIVIPNTNPNPDEIEVFHSTGSGAFTTQLYTNGIGAAPVVIGDLDRDGKLDLVDELNNGEVAILLGTGGGAFGTPTPITVCSESPSAMALADVDGDGVLDLVTSQTAANTVTVVLGRGNGTFASPVTYPVPNPSSMVVADLDGDGRPDIATIDRTNENVDVLLATCVP